MGDTRIMQLLNVVVIGLRGRTSRSGFALEDSPMQSLALMVLRGANCLERFLMDYTSY